MGIRTEQCDKGETADGSGVREGERIRVMMTPFCTRKIPICYTFGISACNVGGPFRFSVFSLSFCEFSSGKWKAPFVFYSFKVHLRRLPYIIQPSVNIRKCWKKLIIKLRILKHDEEKWRHCSEKRRIRFHQTRIQITLSRKSITENLYLMSGDYSHKMCTKPFSVV